VQKSYASVAKRVFNSVETQTMFTWFENTEKPTRLTERENINTITQNIKFFTKTRLATLAYDFCTGESFAAETNLRASGYDIFFSDLTFFYLFFFQKIMTIFR
jgi:hypothetical protein